MMRYREGVCGVRELGGRFRATCWFGGGGSAAAGPGPAVGAGVRAWRGIAAGVSGRETRGQPARAGPGRAGLGRAAVGTAGDSRARSASSDQSDSWARSPEPVPGVGGAAPPGSVRTRSGTERRAAGDMGCECRGGPRAAGLGRGDGQADAAVRGAAGLSRVARDW